MNQTQTLSSPAPVTREPIRRTRTLLPLLVLLTLLTWLIARSGYYTAGDDLGYYMGMVGGLMMLALLLYPLRKHLRFMRYLGAISHWFRLHMVFGVGGPVLIVLHSTYRIGSLNAGVAMGCMLLVAGSGVIGRFIYTRIHHGLYGRKASLEELQTQLGISTGELQSRFRFAPVVEQRLRTFGAIAQNPPRGFFANTWQFLSLGLRARRTRALCMRDLRKILGKHAAERDWDRAKLRGQLDAANNMIAGYLETTRSAAQFNTYERMFSLWHILHVPFVFMLAISGVVHVIAVHMY